MRCFTWGWHTIFDEVKKSLGKVGTMSAEIFLPSTFWADFFLENALKNVDSDELRTNFFSALGLPASTTTVSGLSDFLGSDVTFTSEDFRPSIWACLASDFLSCCGQCYKTFYNRNLRLFVIS